MDKVLTESKTVSEAQTINPQERKSQADVLNILSCLAVVFLHSCSNYFQFSYSRTWVFELFIQVVFRFAVPCFIMLTGANLLDYLERYDTKQYLKRRFSRVLIPFIMWTGVFSLVNNFVFDAGIHFPFTWIRALLKNEATGVYWYIYILIGLYLFIPILALALKGARSVNKEKQTIAGMLFLALPAAYLLDYFQGRGWLNLIQLPFGKNYTYIAYLLLGYTVKKYPLQKKSRIIIYLLGIGSGVFLFIHTLTRSYATGTLSGRFMEYQDWPCVLMSLAVFVGIWYFAPLQKLKPDKQNFLAKYSSLSYGIYLCHILWFIFGDHYIEKQNWNVHAWYFLPIRAITYYFLSVLTIFVLKKIPVLNKLLVS